MKLEAVLESLFPLGSPHWILEDKGDGQIVEKKLDPSKDEDPWASPPNDPIDLFAICAVLMSRSGAYHHVRPDTNDVSDEYRRLVVSNSERSEWQSLGKEWSQNLVDDDNELFFAPPEAVKGLWKSLISEMASPVFLGQEIEDSPPRWWRTTLALFCIADEAAKNVGFYISGDSKGMHGSPLQRALDARMVAMMEPEDDGEGRGAFTLSAAAPDIACILPKSRTPALGCTLRSLSHNLSLLPPRGLARACWLPPVAAPSRQSEGAPLNVLLIPYPYAIAAQSFHGEDPAELQKENRTWGWFEISPPSPENAEDSDNNFKIFIDDLIEKSSKDSKKVDAIIFPELSLSHRKFKILSEHLKKNHDLEFVIAGLSDHKERSGNFVILSLTDFTDGEDENFWIEDARQKHHRWQLERSQISTYSLGASLDVNSMWWERLDIFSRSLTVGVVRGHSTITTLICEDLARVDPAQELLRAIGPNLVIALLMDGPQLSNRWPSRYATVLAEDPGSSVLTLTSLGLIDRVNKANMLPKSQCVALWRDDAGVKELVLPTGASALSITLTPSMIEEHTLDGRSDHGNSIVWRLSGCQPVHSSYDMPDWES